MPHEKKVSKPRTGAALAFISNHYVQTILVLVPLATAFSGKIDSRATGVLLLLAWAVGVYALKNQLISRGVRHRVLAAVFAVAYGVGVWWYFSYLTEPDLEDCAQIAISQVIPVQLPDRPIAFKFYMKNVGKRAATYLQRSPVLRLADAPLSAADEDEGMRILRGQTLEMPPDGNDLQPGDSIWNISTTPLFRDSDLADVRSGRKLVYLMIEVIYRDSRLPTNKSITTDFCAYFTGDMTFYHLCSAHNRVYLTRTGSF